MTLHSNFVSLWYLCLVLVSGWLNEFKSTSCKKCHGKKEPPLWTVDQSLYWAVALGQNSRGRVSKEAQGVFEVWGVGKGFIARAGLPYKEESTGSVVIGVQGLRVGTWLDGLVVGPPPGLVCGTFPGHASTRPGKPQHVRACLNVPDLAQPFTSSLQSFGIVSEVYVLTPF